MSIAINNPDDVRQTPSMSLSRTNEQPFVRSRAETLPRVAFIVNGVANGAMAQRAQAFARRISQHDVQIAYRSANRIVSIFVFLSFLLRTRPSVTYVFDISYSGVLAAALYRVVFGNRLVIDTGDAITELARSMGRSRVGLLLTWLLEKLALRVADRIVVRGSFHRELLARAGINAEVIQDGVDVVSFTPHNVSELRKQNALDGVLTIGLVGSSIWSEKLQMCYGWELVETIRLLNGQPVKGIMIGGGSGIAHLKARCRKYGIEDRVLFLDYVTYDQLPRYLSLIDVCLSTQTNDVVGNVRTTGKLPLYLAAGRFILASNVGEAARVLPKEMLVDYDGVKDETFPVKLAVRIAALLIDPEKLSQRKSSVALARQHFDYSMLARRVEVVIGQAIKNVR